MDYCCFWNRAQSDMDTVSPRTISIPLSDNDCERLLYTAGSRGMTVSQLLSAFVGDLVDGTATNGSDERMHIEDWLARCGFSYVSGDSLLSYLVNNGYSPDEFLELVEASTLYTNDPQAYCDTYGYEPDEIDAEKGPWQREDLEDLLQNWKHRISADMDAEIQTVKRFVAEADRMMGDNHGKI